MWKLLICLFEMEKLYLEVSGTPNVHMVAPPIWHYETHLHMPKHGVYKVYLKTPGHKVAHLHVD